MKSLKKYFLFFILFPVLISFNDIGPKVKRVAKVHIISIGIDKYNGNELKNCVNDAKSIFEKIKKDNKNKIGKTFLLTNEKATIKNIREAFKNIIKESRPDDGFILFFAGVSFSLTDFESVFVLFQENQINYKDSLENKIIKTSELASLMNQISCNDQLIISEAGAGNKFSNSLMSFLFEDNPNIANNTKLKRTIITTPIFGLDAGICDKNHAPLAGYILKSGNIINAFRDIHKYELSLQKSQLECPEKRGAYFIIRTESDFRDLLTFNKRKFNSRGPITKSNKKKEKKEDEISKTYAFIVGTDKYNPNQNNWSDLKNPIKDANAVANLLQSKYDVEVLKVFNKSKNEILKEFIALKSKIDKNDKLILFVAGHGYYNEVLSDGFLVLNDSNSLEEDTFLDSYLPMSKLTRLLNGVPCKQLFTIFDVCFGASFDSNAKDLKLANYSSLKSDISIDDFIKRKDEYTSRIFLASGKGEVPDDYWNSSLQHSPFANKLIDYLKNENKFLSPGKIFAALERNITEPVLKSHDDHEERGDFILKVKNITR